MAFEALILLLFFRPFLRLVPFRYFSRHYGEPQTEMPLQPSADREALLSVRWSLRVATRLLGWSNVCLVQATAAKLMLRRRGIRSSLYLGASFRCRHQLQAHAWLRSGEIMITGDGPGGHAQVAVFTEAEAGLP